MSTIPSEHHNILINKNDLVKLFATRNDQKGTE